MNFAAQCLTMQKAVYLSSSLPSFFLSFSFSCTLWMWAILSEFLSQQFSTSFASGFELSWTSSANPSQKNEYLIQFDLYFLLPCVGWCMVFEDEAILCNLCQHASNLASFNRTTLIWIDSKILQSSNGCIMFSHLLKDAIFPTHSDPIKTDLRPISGS